jgi:hypothetical protein
MPRLQHAAFYSGEDGDETEFTPGTVAFSREIQRTANALFELLTRMRSQRERVFVACPAEDMAETCNRVRGELHSHGYNVRPVGISELDFSSAELVPDEVGDAVAAVFLLGLSFDRFVKYQLDAAVNAGRRPFIWIVPGAREQGDAAQKRLIESVDRFDGLPSNTRLLPATNEPDMISDLVRTLGEPAGQAAANGGGNGVYLICNAAEEGDRALAEQWRSQIESREKIQVSLLQRGEREERHQQLLRECAGALLLQKAAPYPWLEQNARDVYLAERLFQRPPIASKCFLLNDHPQLFANYGIDLVPRPDLVDLSRIERFLAPLRVHPHA